MVLEALVVEERGNGHSESDLQLTGPIPRVLKVEVKPRPIIKVELSPVQDRIEYLSPHSFAMQEQKHRIESCRSRDIDCDVY